MGVLLFSKEGYSGDQISEEIDRIIGKVTDDVIFKKETLERFNLGEKEFNKILVTIVKKYERFKPLWDLLPELQKHYKLAIINNGTALTLEAFKREHSIEGNFDLFVSSAIEGIRKPDERIFLLTAKRLGVLPEECIFMDDSSQNTEGATKTGMQTIHWKNREQGFEDFQTWLRQDGKISI